MVVSTSKRTSVYLHTQWESQSKVRGSVEDDARRQESGNIPARATARHEDWTRSTAMRHNRSVKRFKTSCHMRQHRTIQNSNAGHELDSLFVDELVGVDFEQLHRAHVLGVRPHRGRSRGAAHQATKKA